MIAFTFPGQGSQKPGMGRPWVDHPSWELVGEASSAAGRDVGRLLLDADADDLRQTRNSQLATFILSLVVLDAVERLGVEPARFAGHSLGEYTALTAAGAVEFGDAVRLVVRAGRGDAAGGRGPHRHHGRGHGPRRRRGRDRLPPGRRQRVGGQLQRPGPGRHRRRPRSPRRRRWVRQGARRQAGHEPRRRRRLPHALHGSRPRPADQGPRRRRRPRQRRAGRGQRRRHAALAGRRVGRPCSPPSCAARCAGARRCTTSSEPA